MLRLAKIQLAIFSPPMQARHQSQKGKREGGILHPHFSVPSPSYSYYNQASDTTNILFMVVVLVCCCFFHVCCCNILVGGKKKKSPKWLSCMLWHMRKGVMDGECWGEAAFMAPPPPLCQEQNVGGVSCLRNTSRPRGKFRDAARTVYCIII